MTIRSRFLDKANYETPAQGMLSVTKQSEMALDNDTRGNWRNRSWGAVSKQKSTRDKLLAAVRSGS
jgi:hypothetical protein